MKNMQMKELLLYPRIKKAVKESLDTGKDGLCISHAKIPFTKIIEEMHKLIIEIMQAPIEEIRC